VPRGPRGEKRPADVIGNAVHVIKLAIGKSPKRRSRNVRYFAHRGSPGALSPCPKVPLGDIGRARNECPKVLCRYHVRQERETSPM
jgi:hypothetical protein